MNQWAKDDCNKAQASGDLITEWINTNDGPVYWSGCVIWSKIVVFRRMKVWLLAMMTFTISKNVRNNSKKRALSTRKCFKYKKKQRHSTSISTLNKKSTNWWGYVKRNPTQRWSLHLDPILTFLSNNSSNSKWSTCLLHSPKCQHFRNCDSQHP